MIVPHRRYTVHTNRLSIQIRRIFMHFQKYRLASITELPNLFEAKWLHHNIY